MSLPGTSSPQAQRGIDLHKCVEDKLKLGVSLPAELSHYDTWLESMRGPNCYPEHKVAVNRKWEVCGFEDPDAYIRSVVDLKYVVPQEIVNYDWKTGKMYDDHLDQKKLYAPMVFAEHPEVYSVRSIHVYLDLGRNVEVQFHRDEMPALREGWDRRIAALENDFDFIPSPGYHCKWCPYSRLVGGPCRF